MRAMVAISARDRQGYAAGLNTTYSSIGIITGPLFAGLLFDKHIHIPYSVGALILGLVLVLTMQKKPCEGTGYLL
ncbi:hypothetical protein ABEW19_09250 [Paenibacillus illinoisensis]|uniref:hypothetical protein n=1 Tax=Paenibacillus illinoisensis TaxID=59845 RepID=UPI003D29B694